MNSNVFPPLLLLIIFFIPSFLTAQEGEESVNLYQWFDEIVAVENTGLYNGLEYNEQHMTINQQQKFFKGTNFSPGRVVYEEQPYYNIDMKYNVFDDLLLLRGTGTKPLQLHKLRIKEFSLHGHNFRNVTDDTTGQVKGFFETILVTENLSLLKKHTKKSKKFLDKSFTYFEFYEDTPGYAIAYRGHYFPVNSRREVIRAFPEYNREIRSFYRENRSLARNAPDQFMIRLSKEIIELSSL